MPHYANYTKDYRKLLIFACENLNCPDFFRVIMVETIHFCTVLVSTHHRTYQDVFEACKVTLAFLLSA